MSSRFFDKAKRQSETNEPAAIAMIVRREAPSSGKPGDKAIITQEGHVEGWIGGGCTRGIVIKESLASIKDGQPRLVRIAPSGDYEVSSGVTYYKMTCQSGGSVDVYIEPIMPAKNLIILGRSHIAQALCRIANASGYDVHVVSNLAEVEMFPKADHIFKFSEYQFDTKSRNSPIVVCTQGEEDDTMLEAAVKAKPKYLAFVASRKKANSIFMRLKKRDVSFDKLKGIKTPAGIDINAKTPEEVAISILAEIINNSRAEYKEGPIPKNEVGQGEPNDDLYINPVCKIPIQKSTAKHVLQHEGESVYFCCDGCKRSFEKDPETYISR